MEGKELASWGRKERGIEQAAGEVLVNTDPVDEQRGMKIHIDTQDSIGMESCEQCQEEEGFRVRYHWDQ